jgi:protease I
MAAGLAGKRIAFLATNGVEQVELTEPWRALQDAGAEVHLISLEPGEIQMVRHDERGDRFPVDHVLAEVKVGDYDGLVLPGGVANPDRLRTSEAAVSFVRGFMDADKPVASICHGPWLLVEADEVRGRTLTSWPSLRTDIANAGGEWVDKPVVTDQKLVTSRKPDDLPQFCDKIVGLFAQAIEERKLDRMVEQTFPASDPLPGPGAIGKGPDDEEAPLEQRMP